MGGMDKQTDLRINDRNQNQKLEILHTKTIYLTLLKLKEECQRFKGAVSDAYCLVVDQRVPGGRESLSEKSCRGEQITKHSNKIVYSIKKMCFVLFSIPIPTHT